MRAFAVVVTVADAFLITTLHEDLPAVSCRLIERGGVIMASKAPKCCPSCGEMQGWKAVDQSNKGFSVGKAAAGAVLLGPVGLVGGALGKKSVTYYCQKCGFRNDDKPN